MVDRSALPRQILQAPASSILSFCMVQISGPLCDRAPQLLHGPEALRLTMSLISREGYSPVHLVLRIGLLLSHYRTVVIVVCFTFRQRAPLSARSVECMRPASKRGSWCKGWVGRNGIISGPGWQVKRKQCLFVDRLNSENRLSARHLIPTPPLIQLLEPTTGPSSAPRLAGHSIGRVDSCGYYYLLWSCS